MHAAHARDGSDVEHISKSEHHRRGEHHGQQRVEPDAVPERPGQERGQDQEGAVRDVDHVHHAEDQREPGGEQRVGAADQQAEEEVLDELGHPGGPVT
jgi:hypothetical protein